MEKPLKLVALCLLLMGGLGSTACAQQSSSFYADLAFHFDCKGELTVSHEEAIERFLKEKGFTVMNVVRARRERKMEPMPQHIFIDGIDSERRRIRVAANWGTFGSYNVGFYTPPPTKRAKSLENAILTFVADELKCQARQISRNENGPEKREVYDRSFRRIESRIRGEEL
jgi:hypothetical protein